MAQEQAPSTVQVGIDTTRIWRSLVIVFWLVIGWSIARTMPHPVWPRGAATVFVAAAYMVVLPFASLRSRLEPVLAVSVVSALSVALEVLDPRGPANVTAIAAIVLAGSRLALAPGVTIAALTAIGMFAASLTGAHQTLTNVVFSEASGYFFTFLAGATFSRLRREQQRTADLLREVLAGRDAQVHAAKLDERARLAREMHDVLAHTLAALSIQLEGTRMLAEQRKSDPAVIAALERVTHLSREGLLEARRAVGSLRGDSLPGPDLLPSLVAAFERDAGVPATLQVEGQPRDLPPDARLAIYRTAQEALTNVRKHAEATTVTVTLRYTAQDVELCIADRGRSRPSPVPGGGYGLAGMRERAELLGGRLEAGPTPDGFRVWLWIPESATSR